MVRPVTRRPPVRRTQERMLTAPAVALPRQHSTWMRDSVVCAAAGIGGYGAAPLLAEPQWAIPALAAGTVTAVLRGIAGRRAQARAELTDKLVESLTPLLGLRVPDRRTVRAKSWTRGWPGHPGELELRYAPGVDDSDPLWLQEIADACSRRLLARYTVADHNVRRCRVRLALAAPEPDVAALPAVQARAERTVIELLGPTTKITKVSFDDDQLIDLAVSHEAGTKLAAPQYRHRIERVISTMLPGRWRAHWDLEADTVRFEVRPAMPTKVDHPTPVLTKDTLYKLPMAATEDGKALCWNMRGTAPHLMICGKTGTGKSLSIQLAVPTPSGWTTMGQLRDGDTVFDETGQPCTVTTAHPIRHDRPCYELEFSDGSTIVADAEHLWWTEARLDRVSQSNRRHRDTYRSTPRSPRLSAEVLDNLRIAARHVSRAADLSLPELARLAGLSPSHPVLREIAAQVGPRGTRRRPAAEFHYAEQSVQQRQTVTVFDRPAALHFLAHCAESPRWRYFVDSATLHAVAATATANSELTLAEVGQLLQTSTDTACEVMRHSGVPRGKAKRLVHLQVPARTVHRRLPGIPITTYVAVDLLQSLIAWGEGLAWTPRTARAAGAVRTTEEIAATLRTTSGHANHSIPAAGCVQYPSAEQPIPAYALGAWLGDGSVWDAIITGADPEIALHLEAAGVRVVDRGRPPSKPERYQARTYALRGVRGALNDLGLLRCRDERRRGRSKHIPPNYLLASEEQRRALLAGLLDTDGTVSHTGAVQFDNNNHALALGVHELVSSLGYRGAIRESRATLNGRDCGPKWQVSFTTTDEVFALERKRLVHKERTARVNPDRSRSRCIVGVRPVESVPVRCITVDSPNRLYLVGKSFIPTHNTVTITGVVMEAAARGWPIWMCDPKTVEFIGLRRWPNVQIVATSVADMVVVILRAQQEMERRYAMVEAEQADDDEFEPLILVLDEYRDFMAMVTAWWQSIKQRGMPTKCPVFEAVGSLARKGRTARIHVVMGTQRPDAEFLGGEALAVDTPISTPEGWTAMGKIEVGQRVFAEDGGVCNVTAATEVVEGRPCYKVTFSDGSVIVTDENHLWAATSAVQRAGEAVAARNLSRLRRWPGHARLADRLARMTSSRDDRETTVNEFEREVGQGRIGLLRRGLHDGRFGLTPAGLVPGGKGRFGARTYRFGELVTALRAECAAPAPTWRKAEPQIVRTREMSDSLHYGNRGGSNWAVQVAKPLEMPEADLPVDPWLLGYWLGDGHKATATIATAEEEVLARIRALGYRVTHYARFNYGISTGHRGGAPRPSLKGDLRELGVLGNKHIPITYLRASARQRAELLAGLLDADGTCAVRRNVDTVSGQVTFTNVDRGLIAGVAELAASLGFVPTVRQCRPGGVEAYASSVAYGSVTRPAWMVAFTPDRQVFGIGRKQRALDPALGSPRRVTTRRRYVVDIELVDSVPVRCITVDSPAHLYLAGKSFIPTHNCRDNFASRMSLGRLSPQGAMMMFEAPYIGVSVPRGVPGRGTAVDDDDVPVEVQGFWTPDPRRAEKKGVVEDLAILDRLRPATTRHPRLQVQLAEELLHPIDEDDKSANTGEWQAVLCADLVPALSFDDHNPESTVSMTKAAAATRVPASPAAPEPSEDAPGEGEASEWSVDEEYGPEQDVAARRVRPGDRVLVEPALYLWAVCEFAEHDFDDEDLMVIDWRGDGDENGSMTMPATEIVTVRRPLDPDPEEMSA